MVFRLRTHISLLFLWFFLIPQASNVLHFVLIPHEYGTKKATTPELVSKSRVHYCDQHLFDQPLWYAPWTFELSLTEFPFYDLKCSAILIVFQEFLFRGIFLRGPPVLF